MVPTRRSAPAELLRGAHGCSWRVMPGLSPHWWRARGRWRRCRQQGRGSRNGRCPTWAVSAPRTRPSELQLPVSRPGRPCTGPWPHTLTHRRVVVRAHGCGSAASLWLGLCSAPPRAARGARCSTVSPRGYIGSATLWSCPSARCSPLLSGRCSACGCRPLTAAAPAIPSRRRSRRPSHLSGSAIGSSAACSVPGCPWSSAQAQHT